MTRHGIDYGLGEANVGENGIRYGVIPMNALGEFAHEDFEDSYGPPTCGRCGCDAVEYDDEKHDYCEQEAGCSDYACEHCERVFDSSNAYPDEPLGSYLNDGEYRAERHSDEEVFVLSSPYYTHAQFCSPCAPGACYLLNPVDKTGPKAYCFGHEWFEKGKAPYPVFRVSDGTLVKPGVK